MISLNHKLSMTELLKSGISDIPITPATEQFDIGFDSFGPFSTPDTGSALGTILLGPLGLCMT